MERDRSKKLIIILAGPTASGKTALAAELIRTLPLEIISADSRQVYRELNIGTGKDQSVPQQMIDVIDPPRGPHSVSQCSAAEFARQALRVIRSIVERGAVPIVVGGTGFYIDTLLYEQTVAAVGPNRALRHELEKLTTETALAEVARRDPHSLERLDKHNRRRILRALEIIRSTGSPVPLLKRQLRPQFNPRCFVLDLPREELYRRIDERVERRLKEGMVDEAVGLLQSGVSAAWLESLGLDYYWVTRYVNHQIHYDDMKQRLKYAIHAYARRQLTYFRRWVWAIWGDALVIKENIELLVDQ